MKITLFTGWWAKPGYVTWRRGLVAAVVLMALLSSLIPSRCILGGDGREGEGMGEGLWEGLVGWQLVGTEAKHTMHSSSLEYILYNITGDDKYGPPYSLSNP